MPRSPNRSVTTTFRTLPGVREALEVAAEMENRSMSNLIERLAIEHCRSRGIPIPGLEPGLEPALELGEDSPRGPDAVA